MNAVGDEKRRFPVTLEYVCLLFQRIELLAEPYEVPLICKVAAATRWDNENREIDGASPRGCIYSKCIPREVQAQQAETNQNAQQRIPILYVPLRIFGCLGAVFKGATVTICCTLFTN
jgi:hypothetical protein